MTQEKPIIGRDSAVFNLGRAQGFAMRASDIVTPDNLGRVEDYRYRHADALANLSMAYAKIAEIMFREDAHAKTIPPPPDRIQ